MDDKHVVILGWHVRWTGGGIEYEADPKHRKLIMKHFGFDEESSGLVFNGEKDWKKEEEWEEVLLEKDEVTVFRGVAARANFLPVPCEADEQGDGKANGGQLETYEEDCQVPSQQEESNMAFQLARSYV